VVRLCCLCATTATVAPLWSCRLRALPDPHPHRHPLVCPASVLPCRRQLVLRQHCCKGCQGCLLRSIQRFGRMGKRSWGDAAADAQPSPNSMKVRLAPHVASMWDGWCTFRDSAAVPCQARPLMFGCAASVAWVAHNNLSTDVFPAAHRHRHCPAGPSLHVPQPG